MPIVADENDDLVNPRPWQPKRINAALFQGKLDALAETIIRRLQDEWPAPLQHLFLAQAFFVLSMRYCLFAFRAECELYSDERRADYRWTWDKMVVLPPVNRAMLDSLFNVIFMLEDIPGRSAWYLRSGWREQKLEYDRFSSEYATDPEWVEWLKNVKRIVQDGVQRFGISEDEYLKPGLIKAWPSSGQMPDYEVDPAKRPATREFLQWLNNWFTESTLVWPT